MHDKPPRRHGPSRRHPGVRPRQAAADHRPVGQATPTLGAAGGRFVPYAVVVAVRRHAALLLG